MLLIQALNVSLKLLELYFSINGRVTSITSPLPEQIKTELYSFNSFEKTSPSVVCYNDNCYSIWILNTILFKMDS